MPVAPDFIDKISEPTKREETPDDKVGRHLNEILLALGIIAPAVALAKMSQVCQSSPFSAGLYPSFVFPMPQGDFCPTLTARVTMDYGILLLGGAITLATARWLQGRGRVMRSSAVTAFMMASFVLSVLAFQNTLAELRVFTAEFNGRFSELALMRKHALAKGLTEEVARIDARLHVVAGIPETPAP